MKRKKVEVDLTKQAPPSEYRDGSKGIPVPFDMPLFARVFRLMEPTENHRPEQKVFSQELKGWTLEISAFTFGVKLYVRVGRDGTLKVFAEDGDGTTKLEEWKK